MQQVEKRCAAEDAADLTRTSDGFRIDVWFRPGLNRPERATVEIVDLANLIPVDACDTSAADAVDAFRHPALWSQFYAAVLRGDPDA